MKFWHPNHPVARSSAAWIHIEEVYLWRCFLWQALRDEIYLVFILFHLYLLTLEKSLTAFILKKFFTMTVIQPHCFLLSVTGSVFNTNSIKSGFVALVFTMSWLLLWLKDAVQFPTHKSLIYLRGFRASRLVASCFSRKASVSIRPMSICYLDCQSTEVHLQGNASLVIFQEITKI